MQSGFDVNVFVRQSSGLQNDFQIRMISSTIWQLGHNDLNHLFTPSTVSVGKANFV